MHRATIAVMSIAWGAICLWANAAYLSIKWPQYGFTSELDLVPVAAALVLCGAIGLFIPMRIGSPASLVTTLLALLVSLPTVAITLGQAGGFQYMSLLLAVAIGTVALLAMAVASERVALPGVDARAAPLGFMWAVLAFWVVGTLILIATYWQVMSFVGIEDTYTQRELGRSSSVWMSYLQTYYLNVACPALLAYALTQPRKWVFGVVGIAGFVLVYAITAQKFAVIMPAAMIGVAAALRFRIAYSSLAILFVCLVSAAAVAHTWGAGGRSVPASIVLHRTVGIPALTLSQYYDVFGELGFTRWSHVRGISLFVPPPAELAADPRWPNLGYIVGERALGMPENNVNANPFASDGSGAFGIVGILLISVTLSAWLGAINLASKGWDQRFAMLVMVPVALSLCNGPFFTVMLSFGGIFWFVVFAFGTWQQVGSRRTVAAK